MYKTCLLFLLIPIVSFAMEDPYSFKNRNGFDFDKYGKLKSEIRRMDRSLPVLNVSDVWVSNSFASYNHQNLEVIIKGDGELSIKVEYFLEDKIKDVIIIDIPKEEVEKLKKELNRIY